MVPGPQTALLLAALSALGAQGERRSAPAAGAPAPVSAARVAREQGERIDLPSAEACGGCHPRELAEWSRSLHARAWTNENVRAATDEFRLGQCRACHSPLPVLASGLDRPPDYRDFNQADGVHCLACHGLADGVAAARTIADAPCRPRADARLATAEMCWPCHQPTHHAFDEYAVSRARAAGKRCADCHMEPRADGSGPAHGPSGGFSPEFVRRAITWRAERAGDEVRVTVTNLTGHKFPGEISSRSFLVRVSAAELPEPLCTLLRKPHRDEPRADDRLAPDETRVLRFRLPAGTTRAKVELFFLPLPLVPPERGIALGTWESGG